MQPDTVLVVERVFPHHPTELFHAFTEPAKLAQWFAPQGWHVLPESVEIDAKVGGRLRHTKMRDDGTGQPWVVDGVYTEVFYPDVVVTRQRITGVSGIDPAKPVELRLEFTRMGRDDTLLRVVQGPYTSSAAMDYSDGWESILDRLATFLSTGAQA
ncbi:MAG: SRPBCC domain-containing protein [Micropruina sp.]